MNETGDTGDAAEWTVDCESAVAKTESVKTSQAVSFSMAVGEVRFGITCTGEPIGHSHYLADSMTCGDMVMALPSSVLIAGRTKESGGVAVDMGMFLDAVIEGTAKFKAYEGIAEASSLPVWAVCRLFGTFSVLQAVYDEAMDQAVLMVEAAGMKAAIGMNVKNQRSFRKTKIGTDGLKTVDTADETIEKYIPPDPTLSKLILTSRRRGRYKDEGGMKQAIQINISAAEANL